MRLPSSYPDRSLRSRANRSEACRRASRRLLLHRGGVCSLLPLLALSAPPVSGSRGVPAARLRRRQGLRRVPRRARRWAISSRSGCTRGTPRPTRAWPSRRPSRSPSGAASRWSRRSRPCAWAATPRPRRRNRGNATTTFSIKEGVQCEMCHGPGSEYMDARRDDESRGRDARRPEDADQGGLPELPRRKGLPPDRARAPDVRPGQGLAGNRPSHARRTGNTRNCSRPHRPVAQEPGPAYTGVAVCAECHAGAAWGYQFSKWQASKHADAYASLGTAKAREMAAARRASRATREPARSA